jgi:hypothetical protein
MKKHQSVKSQEPSCLWVTEFDRNKPFRDLSIFLLNETARYSREVLMRNRVEVQKTHRIRIPDDVVESMKDGFYGKT